MSTQTLSVGPNPKIELQRVNGDLAIEGWDRTDLEANGDDLQEIKQSEGTLNISYSGDLKLSVPRKASIIMIYIGGDVSVENLDGEVETCFIGGDARLQNLTGKVAVSGVMGDLQMTNVSNASVEAGSMGRRGDLSEQIRRKVEAATQRAQKQMERSMRRAEQKMRHAERYGRNWNVGWAGGMSPVEPPVEPVSDEERMAILKMLQDRKITSEEAEKLLAALEGGG